MSYTKIFISMLFVVLVGLVGCEKDGPAESAGEKVDEAATDVGNKIEDACEDVKEGVGAEDTNC